MWTTATFGLAQAAPGPEMIGPYLLIGGTILLYVAARAAAELPTGDRGESPSKLALSNWTPIAAAAIAATLMRQTEIAVAIIFATSVASLSMAMGVASIMADEVSSDETPWRRVWPFVLPAAMIALLIGFTGHFRIAHA